MDKMNAPATCNCSARIARPPEISPLSINVRIETPEIKAYHPLIIITKTVKMAKNDKIFLSTRIACGEIPLVVIGGKLLANDSRQNGRKNFEARIGLPPLACGSLR